LELLDTVGIKAPSCLASFILTENMRRMTRHLLKSDVPDSLAENPKKKQALKCLTTNATETCYIPLKR